MTDRALVSIVSISTLLPILAGVLSYKFLSKYFKFWLLYFVSKLIFELPSVSKNLGIFAFKNEIVTGCICIIFVTHLFLLTTIFGQIEVFNSHKSNNLPYYYLLVFYFLSWITLMIFRSDFFNYLMKLNYLSFALIAVLNIIFSIEVLSKEATNLNHKFINDSTVLANIGLLFASVIYLFQYVLVKFGFKDNNNKGTFYTIIECTYILINIIFTFSFVCTRKRKTYHSLSF